MRQSEIKSEKFLLPQKGKIKLILIAGAMLAATVTALAQDGATNAELSQLADLDITNLLTIKVSITSPNEPQTIPQIPAAVSVVTADDIQRSGAQSYPEALRLVPGMDVAQADASQWAVSSRGFNDIFANKLLVMQDGRSIYTPLFSGVFWDVQGTMIEDVDHIEVIRGPGATIWGANAMNGVINIITKNAEDTQGLLASAGGGLQDRGFESARYGGVINSNAFYRVYETYENHDSTVLSNGNDASNAWQLARAGFRTDWFSHSDNAFTFQGDGYAGWIDQVFNVFNPVSVPSFTDTNAETMDVSGANVLGRWTHTISDTSNFKLQAYYDYTARYAPNVLDEHRHTFDLDFKHEFAIGSRNDVTWGFGYRLTTDSEVNNPFVAFNPEAQTINLYSTFVQDVLEIVPNRLSLTFGSKFEQNDYTGFDYQPSGRLLWTPMEHQTFWASVSRAVRTPSREEESVDFNEAEPVPPPAPPGTYVPVTVLGTNTFKDETMTAYEVGYRADPLKNLSFDVAAYWNHYNNLRSQQLLRVFPTPAYYFANEIHGDSYGGEISATWRVADWWRLEPSYSYWKGIFHANTAGGYTDNNSVATYEGSSPENQFQIRSSMDLPHDVTFDIALRYVDRLTFPQPGSTFTVPAYVELGTRLAWRINKHWEVAVVGDNLVHDRHWEFLPTEIQTQATEIPRTIFAKVTFTY